LVGVELPEDGQNALVGEHHLPDGLDPVHQIFGFGDVGSELFAQDPLPRIELEATVNRPLVGRRKVPAVPANLVDQKFCRLDACLLGGVAHVGRGHRVFVVIHVSKVERLGKIAVELLPLGDQALMNGIELV
jgi:hypothetical protein